MRRIVIPFPTPLPSSEEINTNFVYNTGEGQQSLQRIQEQTMPYTIQGKSVFLGAEPIFYEDKHYIPLRDIVEVLGGSVDFEEETKIAHANIGSWTATVLPDNADITVVGNDLTVPVTLTAAPVLSEGALYVPFDFLRDAFGYSVSFEEETLHVVNPNV